MAKKKVRSTRKKTPGKGQGRASSARRATAGSRRKKSTPTGSRGKKTKSRKKTTRKAAKTRTKAKRASRKTSAKKTPARKRTAKKTTRSRSAARNTKKPGRKAAPRKKSITKKKTEETAARSADARKQPPSRPDTKRVPSESAGAGRAKKSTRKGITIVSQKPGKKPTDAKQHEAPRFPPLAESLLGPGKTRRPLIPSGPSAAPAAADTEENRQTAAKSPFRKRQLNRFRSVLLQKRAELICDISAIEEEALMGESGSLSHLPQHMAEQGSETYEQSLSLDLAAMDRKLIREIDAALRRIEEGTYGLCELTGKPINPERLVELPWARFSIDAARQLERQSSRR